MLVKTRILKWNGVCGFSNAIFFFSAPKREQEISLARVREGMMGKGKGVKEVTYTKRHTNRTFRDHSYLPTLHVVSKQASLERWEVRRIKEELQTKDHVQTSASLRAVHYTTVQNATDLENW